MACEAECRAFLTIQAGLYIYICIHIIYMYIYYIYLYIYIYIIYNLYIYIYITKAGREAGQLLFANEVKKRGSGGGSG